MECGYRNDRCSTRHPNGGATLLFVLIIAGSSTAAWEPAHETMQRRNAALPHVEASILSASGVQRLEVRLARGGVTVKVADVPDIHLRVARHSTSTDPRVVVMRTSQADGVVRIVAVHPLPSSDVLHECLYVDEELGDFWHYHVTVDVELTIPARLALRVRTMRGDVAVSGLEGSVDVATNDGNIRLKELGGPLSAAALGSVDLEIGSASNPRRAVQRVTTYSGDLRLRVPTGERVRTDDGLAAVIRGGATELLRTDGIGTREVSVSIGQGSPSIEVGITQGRLIVMPLTSSK